MAKAQPKVKKETPVPKTETKPEAPAAETPEKAAAEPKSRGPKGVADTAVVKLLVNSNPKREGSKAHGRFAAYKASQTVAEALDAGVTTPDLVYDAKHGFISIEGYDPGEIIVAKPKAEPKPKAEKGVKAKAVKSDEQKAKEKQADEEAQEESMA